MLTFREIILFGIMSKDVKATMDYWAGNYYLDIDGDNRVDIFITVNEQESYIYPIGKVVVHTLYEFFYKDDSIVMPYRVWLGAKTRRYYDPKHQINY